MEFAEKSKRSQSQCLIAITAHQVFTQFNFCHNQLHMQAKRVPKLSMPLVSASG